MLNMPLPSSIRPFRNNASQNTESSLQSERVPFLTQEQTFIKCPILEDGSLDDTAAATAAQPDIIKGSTVTCFETSRSASFDDLASRPSPQWRWTAAVPSLKQLLGGRRLSVAHKKNLVERGSLHKSLPTTPLRRVLRLLAFALMLL